MPPVTTNLMLFPNGVSQFQAIAVGGAAGTLTTVGGITTTDRILQVLAEKADASAVLDLTSEFTVLALNSISNAAGTSTSGYLVRATYARGPT